MRQLVLAALVAFALNAAAQQGEQEMPRVDVPGQQAVEKKLVITDKQLDSWDVTGDDRTDIKEQVKKLNTEREALLAELQGKRDALTKARQDLEAALAKLRDQEAGLFRYVKSRVGPRAQENFELRVQLQPIINWLGLSEDKAGELVKARSALVQEYGGPDGNPAKLILEARKEEVTKENRDRLKELTKRYVEFQGKWLKAVEGLLDEKQKDMWRTRYRRTFQTVGGGI